jgi:hypothetical protein
MPLTNSGWDGMGWDWIGKEVTATPWIDSLNFYTKYGVYSPSQSGVLSSLQPPRDAPDTKKREAKSQVQYLDPETPCWCCWLCGRCSSQHTIPPKPPAWGLGCIGSQLRVDAKTPISRNLQDSSGHSWIVWSGRSIAACITLACA